MDVLGNRYQLQEPIGQGDLATIYRGWDTHMERVVAVAVLREVYITDPKFVRRFQKGAEVMYSLQHPNIVQAYDYGQTNGTYYLVMELVDGINLHRYLRSRGILDAGSTVKIAQSVALGLGEAHRRDIVHRNVIPQHILLGRDGSIKLTDFSIGMFLTSGTVQYYAPEQARGVVSPSADVYSLGIVMYEMLTLHPPFDGDSPDALAMQHIHDTPTPPSQYNPTIPPALEEIILRCLEKEPSMRFRDGSQLARALEALSD